MAPQSRIVFLNGQFVPQEQALISVFDRSFLYGDGLFETLRVRKGLVFRWGQHWDRLRRGAEFLKIRLPFPPEELLASVGELVKRNQMPEAILRLTLSRGVGPRGYAPERAKQPTLVMSLHSAPDSQSLAQWRLVTSTLRLPPDNPLAQFKTCNRLPQVLARSEAESAGAQEAILLNTEQWAVEGAASNLFWIEQGVICTAPPDSGILPGITRSIILELCQKLQLPVRLAKSTPEQLQKAEGVLLSLTSLGIAQAVSLNGKLLRQSALTEQLHAAYNQLLANETSSASAPDQPGAGAG